LTTARRTIASNSFVRVLTILVGTGLALAACARDSQKVTREKCERLRDHVVDIQLLRLPSSLAPPSVVTPPDPRAGDRLEAKHIELPPVQPDVAGHRAAMRQALGDAYVTSCQKNLSAALVNCELAAADSVSMIECQKSGTN
jgi:hypothetical protein